MITCITLSVPSCLALKYPKMALKYPKMANLVQKRYVAACELYTFGPCDKDCGGGNQQAVTDMCSGTADESPFPCGMVSVSCNTSPCEGEYIDLGELTKNVSKELH